MKTLTSLIFTIALGACAHQTDGKRTIASTPLKSSHETHFPHLHKHKEGCGHKSKTVGFDQVYIHDGHFHKVHGDHVDDINE